MGLLGVLKHVLGWPLTGSKFLVEFSLEQLQVATLEEVADDARVREDLLELQLLLELGEIDERQYLEREAELMRRFREVREWREQLGLPTRGGPVEAQPPAAREGEADERAGSDRPS